LGYLLEERERRKVEGLFGQYVDPSVVNELVAAFEPELAQHANVGDVVGGAQQGAAQQREHRHESLAAAIDRQPCRDGECTEQDAAECGRARLDAVHRGCKHCHRLSGPAPRQHGDERWIEEQSQHE